MSRPLRNERDMIRELEAGTYTMGRLYQLAEQLGLADRPGGRDRIGDGREQFKRRVRTAVYERHRLGQPGLRKVPAEGGACWVVEGTIEQPRRMLLLWLPRDRAQAMLVLGQAVEILAACGQPVDLVVADPPWGLGRDRKNPNYRHQYGRDHSLVVPGYVDVDPRDYPAFTREWMEAAAAAIRPGGYLAVITGPQQAGRVQTTAEDYTGLTYVNSIAVERQRGMPTTRRLVHAHNVVTLLTKGPLKNPARVFHPPPGSPRGRNGGVYAVDVWSDIPEYSRPGLLRYDNALHPALVSRIIRMTTDEDNRVCDPFLGGGATLEACLRLNRVFIGGDVNPGSLRFSAARVLAEVAPEIEAVEQQNRLQPPLFELESSW